MQRKPTESSQFHRQNGIERAEVAATQWRRVTPDMSTLLAEAFASLAAWRANTQPDLDRVRLFVRYDSGRITLAAVDEFSDLIAGAPAFAIRLVKLEALYHRLPNVDDGRQFDAAYRKLGQAFRQHLTRWLASRRVSAAIAQVRRVGRFRITLTVYDDAGTERTIARPRLTGSVA